MKGASNVHQVQIGNKRVVGDYQSLTAMQQSGHKQKGNDKLKKNDDFTVVRAKIAEQTKDLRSSHFALGGDKTPAQANSSIVYQAPPTKVLISTTNDNKDAREKLQSSNFTIKDAHGVTNQPATTQNMTNQ